MIPDTQLFTLALGLQAPWFIADVHFDADQEELHLTLGFAEDAVFHLSPDSAERGRPYDTRERTWRHLDFWQHKTYLSARVPRIQCADGSVKMIEVPWARKGSGFTLLFESSALLLMREMPVAAVARRLREHDTRLWRILQHYVENWKPRIDMSQTTTICVDETASKRGHAYITLVIDGETRRLLYATKGRDKSTLGKFSLEMQARGGDPQRVRFAAIDMGNPFKGGIRDFFKNAIITFDRFHITQWMNKAVDTVRRQEVAQNAAIKGTKFLWMKRHEKLSESERNQLGVFIKSRTQTARAYQLKVLWEDFYKQTKADDAKGFLKALVNAAIESRILPMMKIACQINAQPKPFISWIESRLSTAIN